MAKITLNDLTTNYGSQSLHNTNNATIEDHLNNKVLYRNNPSGEANQMENELDMNSNKIINLADGVFNTDAVTVAQINAVITGSGATVPAVAQSRETQLGSAAVSRVFTFSGITYVVGANTLSVYRNGQRLERTEDYTETSTSSITLTFDPNDNDRFVFVTNDLNTSGVTTTSAITHTEDSTDYNLQTYLANRHVVSVRDFGAVGDGVTDDTAAIQAAIAAAPAGSIIVGTPGDVYNFGTITGNSTKFTISKELHFDWQWAKLLCAGENDSGYLSTALFKFEDANGSFKNYTFEDSAFLFAGPSRGVMPVVINNTAASTSGYEIGPCHIVKGQSFLTCGSGTPATYRASDIQLCGPMTADEVYYGVNLAQNGDNVRGSISADSYNRIVFLYDVSDVDISVHGGTGAQATSASINIVTYGDLPTQDIKIRAVLETINGNVRLLDDSSQSGGAGIFRNIDLDLTVRSYGANLPSTSNAIVQLGAGTSSFDATSTTTMDNIKIDFKSPITRPRNPIVQQTVSPNYGLLYMPSLWGNQVYDFTSVVCGKYIRSLVGATLQTSITAATQANPVQVTSAGHGFETGDKVAIMDVTGMTEINDRLFTITKVDNDNFTLDGEDGTGHTAYSSGGTAHATISTDISLLMSREDLGNVMVDQLLGVGEDTSFASQNSVVEHQRIIGYVSSSALAIEASAQVSQQQAGTGTITAHQFADGSNLHTAIKGYTTTSGNITSKIELLR